MDLLQLRVIERVLEGTEHFGKGVLKPDASGRELVGTWGDTQADSGAGT